MNYTGGNRQFLVVLSYSGAVILKDPIAEPKNSRLTMLCNKPDLILEVLSELALYFSNIPNNRQVQ